MQGNCVFVMHFENAGAGDGRFCLLRVVNWISELTWLGEGRERDWDIEIVGA